MDPLRGPPPPRGEVVADFGLAAVPLALSIAGSAWAAGTSPAGSGGAGMVSLLSLLLYLLLVALLLRSAARHLPAGLPGGGLGPANRVTLLRAALVLPLAALLPFWGGLDALALWWVIAVGTAVLVLDGVDGRVARHTGTATPFGARFDMELDAFLILVLALGVWQGGRVGGWVLLIGALRYLFVAAAWVLPAMRAPLPESFRRKAICVVQGIGLLVCLGPIIPDWGARGAAVATLTLLIYSFGVDTLWLLRRGRADDPGVITNP